MLDRISNIVQSWREQRRGSIEHSQTLRSYRLGEYPDNPTIGLGAAFQAGLLEPKVLCQYAWTQKALHEGPVYLEAWRTASTGLKRTKTSSYYPYLPKNALDVAMSASQMDWKKGWGPESAEDKASPAMRLVQWVHTRDPNWIGNHLDDTFFSSSMSVWDTLLYHDTSTSSWVMANWPERLAGEKFAWGDWLAHTGLWMYPILSRSHQFPKEQWQEVANHLANWAPLSDAQPERKVRNAVALIGFPGKEFRDHDSSSRALLWKALTRGVPADMADPIGAALACAWPDMHPEAAAIKRHFYPQLENTAFAYNASLPDDTGFSTHDCGSSGALATAFLYDTPQAWVQAMMDTWSLTKTAAGAPSMEMELPSNLLD